MAVVPDLIGALSDKEANADFRRQIGKTLIDLAAMTREPATTSEKARQIWQSQLTTLSDLTHHPKTTIRLVTLNVLEALGQEAAQAKPAIVQALGDPDRFVRWSAVRALEAIGLDQSSMQSLATLQHDPDVDVQKAAVSVLQAVSGGAEALALQQKTPPLKTAVLAEAGPKSPVATVKTPAMAKANAPANDADTSSKKIYNKWVKATPKPADANQSTSAPTTEASAPAVDSFAKAKSASGLTPPPAYPAASPEGEALALRSAPIIMPKTFPSTAIRRAPEAFSAEIAEVSPPSNPISKTAEPEPIAPKPEAVPLISSTTPLDVQPSMTVPPATMPQLAAPTSGMQRAPESLQLSGSEPLPLWTPSAPVLKGNEIKAAVPVAPPAPVKQPAIQPISAQITAPDPTPKKAPNPKSAELNQQLMTDILKLNSARVGDQIEGIRSLGKLGPNAADAVPPLAEKLVKGETLVRREVPLALMQIGAPAKLAQTVLERALDDQDTDVRVNAARALLELSDK
jgi:HEAT repeat protein